MSSTNDASRPLSLESWLERTYRFDVIADPDGGYVVTFPDLPGCMTQVDTLDELPEMTTQAKSIWMRSMFERGLEIPSPTYPESASGKFLVRLPRMLHRALIDRAEEEGVSLNQLVACLLSSGVARNAANLARPAESVTGVSDKPATQRSGRAA